MQIITSIVIQALLIGLALFVTILRCWVRLRVEHRALTISDYFIWAGWALALGWFICSIKALYLEIDHPLVEPDLTTDSVTYLKTVFVAIYFFDIGLYCPKASIVAFYWWLIPQGFRRLRMGLYVGTAYMCCAFLASILMDSLACTPISDNWSIENQLDSAWNSYTDFTVNWALNFSTDILLFCLPFFIINCLKLRHRQKIGLVGVFSLGAITMIISLARFIAYTVTDYNVDDASGNAWCTAEMCTAVIVASLPGLKALIVRASTPSQTYDRSNAGYVQTGSGQPFSNKGTGMRSHVQAGKSDDEIELVFLDRKPSPSPTGTTIGTGGGEGVAGSQSNKDGVTVTTNVTVTHDVL